MAFDTDCKITLLNPALEQIWGKEETGCLDQNVFEVFPFLKKNGCDVFFQLALSGQTCIAQEGQYLNFSTGFEGFFEGRFSSLQNEAGDIIGGLAVIHDTTEQKQAEELLKEKQNELKNLVDAIPDMVWACDENECFTFASEGWKTIAGYEIDDLIGRSFYDIMVKEDEAEFGHDAVEFQEGVKDKFDGLKQVHESYRDFLNWNYHKNGEKRCHSSSAVPRYNKNGKFIGYIGIDKDVTEKIQAEEALKESEERYRCFVNHSSEGIYRVDIVPPVSIDLSQNEIVAYINEHAVLAEANDALAHMYGLDVRDMIGRKATDFAPEYGVRAELVLQQPGYQVTNTETLDVDKDNKPIYLEESYHGEVKDGHLVRIWGVQRNISDRKKAEKAIKESEKQFRFVLENSRDAIYKLNLETGTYDYMSPACENVFGYTPEEFIANGLEKTASLIHPDDRITLEKHFEKLFAKTLEEQITPTLEYRFMHKCLGYRWISDTRTVVYNDESVPVALVGSARDITDLKKAEEELLQTQRLKSIGTLAGGIAHDFNNILLAMFGNISLLKDKFKKNDPESKLIQKSELALERAKHLTNQLLTFAKGGEPVKTNVSLGALVQNVVDFDLSGSNVKLVFTQDDDLWMADIDKGQIQQVFSNLTINAKHAMPDGGKLFINLENVHVSNDEFLNLKSGNYIKVTVTDEGIGICVKDLDKIFDPYFSTKDTGSGLGLATAYSIITKHDGHIAVESEIGKGTVFTLYLPATTGVAPAEPYTPQVEAEKNVAGARILVMDDDEMVREVVAFMLERNGFLVEATVDGEEAIERYIHAWEAKQPFDLVIMDLTVPGGKGGKVAIKDLLAFDPEAKVIVSSGYAEDPIMANYADYGFKAVATKPFGVKKLIKLIKQVLAE